jgi:FtsP/CotA-like multicopper oxidase with cupredoxin domain
VRRKDGRGRETRDEIGTSGERKSMNNFEESRRRFLKTAGIATGALLLSSKNCLAQTEATTESSASDITQVDSGAADYTLHIKNSPIEVAPKRIISATTYNGQFPGPLLRFKEGQQAAIDVYNDTDTPEQLHWHGQQVPVDVDGAAEEGTPFIPAHGKRRIVFTPKPAGLRFYHTHNRAGANLAAGQYSGQVGPVYIEPRHEPGKYDREVFLTLKEFEPTFSRGGDMAMDFLSPSASDKSLQETGESAMKASLAKGMPHGYEVGYRSFTINGRMLGHGEPIRVKQGERVLFHVLNGSATEIRSLALPGHSFQVVALDGNPVPIRMKVPVLWLGTAERISAIVEMNHPGVWILGDLDNDDRPHGMGIVVEYAGRRGKAQWVAPPAISLELPAFRETRCECSSSRRNIRSDLRKRKCRRRRF